MQNMKLALTDLFGKKLALLLWYIDQDFEERAVIVSGVGFLHDGCLSLHRGHLLPPLRIPLALVWRAQEVPDELKDIVTGAQYLIQASLAEMEIKGKAG